MLAAKERAAGSRSRAALLGASDASSTEHGEPAASTRPSAGGPVTAPGAAPSAPAVARPESGRARVPTAPPPRSDGDDSARGAEGQVDTLARLREAKRRARR